MKKCGIFLLPDACYLSELNVPGKPNRTNLGKCAAIRRFLSTHPNENLPILMPYRNQRALRVYLKTPNAPGQRAF